jgi:hypothetical protein
MPGIENSVTAGDHDRPFSLHKQKSPRSFMAL